MKVDMRELLKVIMKKLIVFMMFYLVFVMFYFVLFVSLSFGQDSGRMQDSIIERQWNG